MKNSDWFKKKEKENNLFNSAKLAKKKFCSDNGIFIYDCLYETPKAKDKVSVNDGTWLKFQTKCKGGNQIHIKNIKKDYRQVIRSYACFLRAVGVDNEHAMEYYILHFTTYYISLYTGGNFYNWKTNRVERKEGLKINYAKTINLIHSVIKWVMNKDISDIDISKFIDTRKRKAPELNIANSRLEKSHKMRIVKQDENKELYERIEKLYNPDLTNEENCKIINVCEHTLIKWKKVNTESKEERINRLYNPNLSWKKNEEIIGLSRNTIKKYLINKEDIGNKSVIMLAVENNFKEVKQEERKAESKNEPVVEGKLDLENDDLLSKIFGSEFFKSIEEEKAKWDKFEDHKTFKGFDFL